MLPLIIHGSLRRINPPKGKNIPMDKSKLGSGILT